MCENIDDRRTVANMLRCVLAGKICVREAMLNYPKDTQDESLIAAYHALIHYEADEDLRLRDNLYKEEQDDYIEFIANTLYNGEDLPKNIIENYKNFYATAPILHKNNPQGFIKSFLRMLNINNS